MTLTLHRTYGWRARLFSFLDDHKRHPFQYGDGGDCVLYFALGVINSITGKDLASEIQIPSYSDLPGALAALESQGVSSIGDLLAKYLPEIHPSLANLGDLGVVESSGDFGQGVCMFDASGLVVCTNEGQGRLRRSRATRAFQVGESQK